MSDLQKQKIEIEKRKWLLPKTLRNKPTEKIADSNDFIFDRKSLTITKKGQMNLF